MASLKDLMDQRASLDRQIQETKSRERNEAIAKVKALMSDYGLTVADLRMRTPKADKVSKVPAKYINKATGEAWSGRGLQPKWLKAAIAAGAKLQDFSV